MPPMTRLPLRLAETRTSRSPGAMVPGFRSFDEGLRHDECETSADWKSGPDLALGTTLHRASGKPAGELVFGGVHLPYTPLSGDPRQPTARRTSPAHLFVGSLGASYALTLAQQLDAAALPWCSLDILSEASLVSTQGIKQWQCIPPNVDALHKRKA